MTDKPELAVASDGQCIAAVYESGPGPTIVTTADAGITWNEPRVVEPGKARHFWPEALTFAPDGALWFAVPSMSDSDIAKRIQTDVQLHVYRSSDDGHTWKDSSVSSSPRFPHGFATIYGHYGGASISANGHLVAVWAEGEPNYRVGNVWFNSPQFAEAKRRR